MNFKGIINKVYGFFKPDNRENYILNNKGGKKNTSGILYVSKITKTDLKQGFTWIYQYYNEDTGKKTSFNRVNFNELEIAVKSKNLPWIVLDEDKYKNIKKMYPDVKTDKGGVDSNRHFVNISKSANTTGIMFVYKRKTKTYKQGFTWSYHYYGEDGKRKFITRINLDDLEVAVKSKGFEWVILDEEKYHKSLELNKKYHG